MVLGPDGATLFAVNHGAGTVSVVDTPSQRVVDRLVVGEGPSNIIALGDAGNH
jgi:YVTN family beta-propeller protein